MKKHIKDEKLEFNKKISGINYSPKNPLYAVEYRPKLETSYECTEDQVNLFHNPIGLICLIIELGRIEIAFKVSPLSTFLENLITGNLIKSLHVFKYL